MDIQLIQEEVTKVIKSTIADKTDKQLWVYQELHERYLFEKRNQQPAALVKFNNPVNRRCKLTQHQVNEIRSRYIPHVYGKKRLSKDFGVSPSVILRILKGSSWKDYEDSG